jgi:hypothetical protein
MRVKAKKAGKNGVSLTIACDYCGKPISRTSDFGMDCEDQCSEQEFNKSGGMEGILKMFKRVVR